MMHHRQGHMRFFGGFPFNLILTVILIILFVVLLVKLIQYLSNNKPNKSSSTSNARKILDERFARGEIDVEEYKMRKEMLEDQEA